MHLEDVIFPNNDAAATLISCSPVLEELVIRRRPIDNVVDLRVCSKSLMSFTLTLVDIGDYEDSGKIIVIDAPRLAYLSLKEYQHKRFIIINMSALVKVDIDVDFDWTLDNLWERNIIYNLLTNVLGVRDMTIS